MNIIALPDALFSDPEYKSLKNGHRLFLFDLYVMFNDCLNFTINLSNPEEYGQPYMPTLCRRIQALNESGLLQIVDRKSTGSGHYVRVFSFKHLAPFIELEIAA